MEPTFFEAAVVERLRDGAVVLALFDGSEEHGSPQACVGLFECHSESAAALFDALGSALKSQE